MSTDSSSRASSADPSQIQLSPQEEELLDRMYGPPKEPDSIGEDDPVLYEPMKDPVRDTCRNGEHAGHVLDRQAWRMIYRRALDSKQPFRCPFSRRTLSKEFIDRELRVVSREDRAREMLEPRRQCALAFKKLEELQEGLEESQEVWNREFVRVEEKCNQRFASAEEKFNKRFASVEEECNQRFISVEEKCNQRFARLEEQMILFQEEGARSRELLARSQEKMARGEAEIARRQAFLDEVLAMPDVTPAQPSFAEQKAAIMERLAQEREEQRRRDARPLSEKVSEATSHCARSVWQGIKGMATRFFLL